ncbi:MAG: methylmalonyl Co-A mutase-associated GTPase MeaB [Synergistetes bacterium]|nr:MAG: Lysine arginine ornithine transport system kinase [bacterium 42_11]MBC7331808.1 methylmalonyl Co-A mutase-associated GTPase MeaB [Synergistota bacterium]MDK2871626.1 GTPase [bacterium]
MRELLERALKGDFVAIGKLISVLEKEGEERRELLKEIAPLVGKAYYIGITGAPGVGKSTLVDKMVGFLRGEGYKVGVIAIDPSSPFSGGAFLGDRLRMQRHATDPGVFIRSMGSRGALGGLSKAAPYVAKLLDACGFDFIILETVGAGQSEVDIVKTADTVIIVLVPGMGDEVQIIKAGIMEIGDIFVVNKSDKEGAQKLTRELETWIELGYKGASWVPPVLMTIAENGTGVDKLINALKGHRKYLLESGELEKRRRKRIAEEISKAVEDMLKERIVKNLNKEQMNLYVDLVLNGKRDPYSIAEELVNNLY